MTSASTWQNLSKWFKDNGISYDEEKLEICYDEKRADSVVGAFSVVARQDLLPSFEVAKIPKSSVLSAHAATCADILDDENLGGGVALTIAVLHEKQLSEKSRWWGYLQSLPPKVDLPVLWPTDSQAFQYLKGTDLESSVLDDKKYNREDYENLVIPLLKKYPQVFSPEFFTFEAYQNISTVVASRAFEVDSIHGDAMVPFADLFNHQTLKEHVHIENEEDEEEEEEVEEEKDGEHVKKSNQEEKAVLTVNVIRKCDKDHEVYNTYGEHGNAYLLGKYGFAQLDNPADGVSIKVTAVVDELCKSSPRDLVERKLKWFWRCIRFFDSDEEAEEDGEEEVQEFFGIMADGTIEDRLLWFITLVTEVGDNNDLHLFGGSVEKFSKWIKEKTVQVFSTEAKDAKKRKQEQQKGKQVLAACLMNRIKAYGSKSIEKEEDLLTSAYWAKIYRLGERSILQKAWQKYQLSLENGQPFNKKLRM